MARPVLLMILDGYGISEATRGNAVRNASTPNLDALQTQCPCVALRASGEAVGLPEGQIGNSEVGHLHIGAGRVVPTGLSLINKAVADRSIAKNPALLGALRHARENGSKFHVMGLFSHGGVHSSLEHIVALLEAASANGARAVLHVFGDGRDVPPQTILDDLRETLPKLRALNAKIGVISGRYYAMDRDRRWDRIDLAYAALTEAKGNRFTDPLRYVQDQYDKGIDDEFLEPAVNALEDPSAVTIQDGDAVFFANFRPDRARQMSHYVYGSDYYDAIPPLRRKNLYYVTMMQYEGIEPTAVAFPPTAQANTMGEAVAKAGLSQLRIAETEKYAHVTFFFDGGKETQYPNETKILVPSNKKVATYDLAPEMACEAITDRLVEQIGKHDLVVLNYANPDMVGHTGKYGPTVRALEFLDGQIGRVVETCARRGVTLFLTADHGNAEEMEDDRGEPVTKHTKNPVPFACTDRTIALDADPFASLANVAPTVLEYMGVRVPPEMTEKSLLRRGHGDFQDDRGDR